MTATPANPLIDALLDPERYPHPATGVELIETHISWVLLAGDFVYKIKKPVDLGFLDFSTLAKRRRYCQEELRLNRRLAPALYLDVVPIAGTPDAPILGGGGEPIEFALKMARFPQEGRLDQVLARGELTCQHIDDLAAEIARLHSTAAIAAEDTDWGTPPLVRQAVEDCLRIARRGMTAPEDRALLDTVGSWAERRYADLAGTFARRKAEGFVREGHGDLHLANMALVGGRVTLFDCLEFSQRLRWIDVACDLAFAVMDLADRGRTDLSRRLLNACLEHSADYAGLAVLPYYLVYRALVRAEVAAIRAAQAGIEPAEAGRQRAEAHGYLKLAADYARPPRPALLVTHGVSGCGKSYHSEALVESLGAVRIRSDVERKRLFGLTPGDRTPAVRVAEVYGDEASRVTYERLLALARTILAAGWPAIVDATFLKRAHRAPFRLLAEELGVPFALLTFACTAEELRKRVAERQAAGRDPSEATLAVLEQQLREVEAPGPDEQAGSVPLGTDRAQATADVERAIGRR
jgi:aminoglycoside phosphotransferase family enzyme/predicted kinase